jgi:hypothetical protein
MEARRQPTVGIVTDLTLQQSQNNHQGVLAGPLIRYSSGSSLSQGDAGAGHSNDRKTPSPPGHPLPTLPSQTALIIPSQPENTRLQLHKARHSKEDRLHPVKESPRYARYRSRQRQHQHESDEQKWPDDLERAFLDGE